MEVHEPAVAPPGRGSSATALLVRRLVTAVMRPQEDITDRLASPDIPSLRIRDPDLARIVRRSSGTVAPDGQLDYLAPLAQPQSRSVAHPASAGSGRGGVACRHHEPGSALGHMPRARAWQASGTRTASVSDDALGGPGER